MPNIEIHGLGRTTKVKSLIDEKMQKIGYSDEAITNAFLSNPLSCDGDCIPKPFLRVCVSFKHDGSHNNEMSNIINALKELKLSLDVETLTLDSFIPKEEMV